jgi:phosphoglycolate phosphatase
MRDLGLRDVFGALVGADTLPVKKPDPAPLVEAIRRLGGARDRALLVGDTPTDRNTSRAAGVPSVLVTFGPLGQGVHDLTPDATIDHFRELPAVVARLIG